MSHDRQMYLICFQNSSEIKTILRTQKEEYEKKMRENRQQTEYDLPDTEFKKLYDLGNICLAGKDYKLLAILSHIWLTVFNLDR